MPTASVSHSLNSKRNVSDGSFLLFEVCFKRSFKSKQQNSKIPGATDLKVALQNGRLNARNQRLAQLRPHHSLGGSGGDHAKSLLI